MFLGGDGVWKSSLKLLSRGRRGGVCNEKIGECCVSEGGEDGEGRLSGITSDL